MTDRGAQGAEHADFVDPLAAALWQARQQRDVLTSVEDFEGLSLSRATAIGAELYERLGPQKTSAWKMGAFDEATQSRLGLTGPLVAPVLPDRLVRDGNEVSIRLDDFVDARFEAEIGIWADGHELLFCPCVEVADSRFADWALPPLAALADFGLQGAMVFGRPVPARERVDVQIRHEGRLVARATGDWTEACRRMEHLPPPRAGGRLVATGAVTNLISVDRGRWEFEFADLGAIRIDVD